MIDNLEKILKLLKFESNDDFYFLSLIQRKKDIPELTGRNNSSRCIKNYYVTSKEYLIDRYEEIKSICNTTKARACINLNKRSFRKVALESLRLTTEHIIGEQYSNIKRSFDSACGSSSSVGDKLWIVDIDTKEQTMIDYVIKIFEQCEPIGKKYMDMNLK